LAARQFEALAQEIESLVPLSAKLSAQLK